MVKNGEHFMIKEMQQKGMNITQIANELGRDRKTIRSWLQEEDVKEYRRQTNVLKCLLDPFKLYVKERMNEGCLNAVVIFDEIKAKGYAGKTTMLRYFMSPLRPTVMSKVTERYETPPGKQAQVDWGHFRVKWNGTHKRIYAFVMVLGYSRMMYVEFTENERLETLMGCHLRAMQYFGGRTETCLYDNMKTVVTGQDTQGEVVWNERFAKFASHHGFILRRCRPYRARTKGKVENGVGYIRKNFWPRVRSFTDLHDLNVQARIWMDTIANVRIHGTTHEIPRERWKQEELKPFNLVLFETMYRHDRKVSADCFVSYEAHRYSVPHRYVGQIIQLQDEQNGRIRMYVDEDLIAEHVKPTGRHQVMINKKHFEGIRTAGNSKVATPMPLLVPSPIPEVVKRDLSVYEAFSEQAVLS
jgi:transposase